MAKTIFYSLVALVRKILFCHSKIKFISSRHRVISSIYFMREFSTLHVFDSPLYSNSWCLTHNWISRICSACVRVVTCTTCNQRRLSCWSLPFKLLPVTSSRIHESEGFEWKCRSYSLFALKQLLRVTDGPGKKWFCPAIAGA